MEHIKFAVINGSNDINDGEIDIVYGDEDSYHNILLTDYIKSKGLDKLGNNLNFADANNLSLFLREQGKVVFLNRTSYKRVIKSSEAGIFIMPDSLSEMQKEKLLEFNEFIDNFEEIEIWYDFVSHAECKTLFSQDKIQARTIINHYVEELCNKKTK